MNDDPLTFESINNYLDNQGWFLEESKPGRFWVCEKTTRTDIMGIDLDSGRWYWSAIEFDFEFQPFKNMGEFIRLWEAARPILEAQ